MFLKLGVFLTLWSGLGLVILLHLSDQYARRARIDAACYYYRKNGVPVSITIEGTTVRLSSDGSIVFEDRVFLNPYHEELLRGLADRDCTFIDTK